MVGISASLWSNFQCLEIETNECNTILFSLVFKTIIPYRVNLNHLLQFYTNSGNVDSIPIFSPWKAFILMLRDKTSYLVLALWNLSCNLHQITYFFFSKINNIWLELNSWISIIISSTISNDINLFLLQNLDWNQEKVKILATFPKSSILTPSEYWSLGWSGAKVTVRSILLPGGTLPSAGTKSNTFWPLLFWVPEREFFICLYVIMNDP